MFAISSGLASRPRIACANQRLLGDQVEPGGHFYDEAPGANRLVKYRSGRTP